MRCMKCKQEKEPQFAEQRICKQCSTENSKQRTPKLLRSGASKKPKHKQEGYT